MVWCILLYRQCSCNAHVFFCCGWVYPNNCFLLLLPGSRRRRRGRLPPLSSSIVAFSLALVEAVFFFLSLLFFFLSSGNRHASISAHRSAFAFPLLIKTRRIKVACSLQVFLVHSLPRKTKILQHFKKRPDYVNMEG